MRIRFHILIAIGLLGAGWLLGASAMPYASNSAVTVPVVVENPPRTAALAPAKLEVVNPTLASLELRFEPAAAPAEPLSVDPIDQSAVRPAPATAGTTIIDAATNSTSMYELNRSVSDADEVFDWADALQPGSIRTGWADGYGRSELPIPGLNWRTDWNTTFSVRLSHQTWRESTDIAVSGMFSIDF